MKNRPIAENNHKQPVTASNMNKLYAPDPRNFPVIKVTHDAYGTLVLKQSDINFS